MIMSLIDAGFCGWSCSKKGGWCRSSDCLLYPDCTTWYGSFCRRQTQACSSSLAAVLAKLGVYVAHTGAVAHACVRLCDECTDKPKMLCDQTIDVWVQHAVLDGAHEVGRLVSRLSQG